MKKQIRERNERILIAFYEKRREGKTIAKTIEEIQMDKVLNPTMLSYDYIRRHIVFGRRSLR